MFRSLFSQVRTFASYNRVKPHRKPIVYHKVDKEAVTLRDRGFLRPQKAYQPPDDAQTRIDGVVSEIGGIKDFEKQKFELLSKCATAFNNHYVPNSLLHEIKCIDDVVDFYHTAVDVRTPYETLDKTIPNLHVIPEYRRYDPEEDGVSAFPKSSTLVTGLKYRKKYKGHTAKTSWP